MQGSNGVSMLEEVGIEFLGSVQCSVQEKFCDTVCLDEF